MVQNGVISNSTSSVYDQHTQILEKITESFIKLFSVIGDKITKGKIEWPEFGGYSKKFEQWYLAIIVQLSFLILRELNDASIKNIIVITSYKVSLKVKLYAF